MGAVLAAASLAMLGVAAKLSIVLTGLSPPMPSADDPPSDDEAVPADIGAARAERGHQMLTGLLAGFSLSAALGAVLVAAGQRDEKCAERCRAHRCRFRGADPSGCASSEESSVPLWSSELDWSAPPHLSRSLADVGTADMPSGSA